MLLIATVGNESHTSSASRVYAKVNGEYLGYKQAKKKEQIEYDKHARWDRYEFDLPEGTLLELTISGQDGNHGSRKYRTVATYRLDSTADPVEVCIPSGPGGDGPWLRGRLVEVTKTDPTPKVDVSLSRF